MNESKNALQKRLFFLTVIKRGGEGGKGKRREGSSRRGGEEVGGEGKGR